MRTLRTILLAALLPLASIATAQDTGGFVPNQASEVVLGDLLNLLIAVEVLQNITSYLRRHVVQIELVLITAMTAVARKVIVLPPGAESKPQLLAGLGRLARQRQPAA